MSNPSTGSDTATELSPPGRWPKRAGRIWARVLLALVGLVAALIGVWFLGVRPSLHLQDLLQVDRDWNVAMFDAFALLTTVPHGSQNIVMSERSINTTLNFDHTAQAAHWQMTVTPANIRVSFTGCDHTCPFTAVLNVSTSGRIQVTQVHVQGMFALIMSDDELTNYLNNKLEHFFIPRITKITLLEHAIDIQLN